MLDRQVKGSQAAKDYMASIRPMGPAKGSDEMKAKMAKLRSMRSEASRSPIKERQAVIAFNKYYKNMKTTSTKVTKDGNNLGRQMAKAYDANYTNSPVVNDRRYLRSPHKYDFAGVDAGPKTRTRTDAQRANDRLLKGKPVRRQGGGAEECKYKASTQACGRSNEHDSNPEYCETNPKTNRCRGTDLKPKKASNVARGKSLGASRKASPRKSSPKAPSYCATLTPLGLESCAGEYDRGCRWTKGHTLKSGKEVKGHCGDFSHAGRKKK